MKFHRFCPIFILFTYTASLQPQKSDPSTVEYEKGISAYLQGDLERAEKSLERAASSSGESSEMARLALIRILAIRSGIGGIRPLLETGDSDMGPVIWFSAIHALIEGDRARDAEDLAIEFLHKYPESELRDDTEFALAEIFYQKKEFQASLDRLTNIIEMYPEGDAIDDAYFLLSKIFGTPGDLYSPSREYRIVTEFTRSKRAVFINSIHLSFMKARLRRLRTGFRRVTGTE